MKVREKDKTKERYDPEVVKKLPKVHQRLLEIEQKARRESGE